MTRAELENEKLKLEIEILKKQIENMELTNNFKKAQTKLMLARAERKEK